ncbi:MAG: hypothetical protein QGI78_03700 [Phycisphaerales bacterium]|jgi:hypothetical protein|nr:hypothetical protein [Phycisphaerales bacterium]
MALFGKKSKEEEPVFVPSPAEAKAWFDRAREMSESKNFDSAFTFYASGFKLDPRDLSIHDEVLKLASEYYRQVGDVATSKQIKLIDGPTDIDHFVAALYAWWHDISNPKLGIKAITTAVKAEQSTFGVAMADTILNLSQQGDKILSAKELKNLMELFKSTGAWDQAIKVGHAALQADRSDSALEKSLNELAAERAMAEGGYNEGVGEEGGFRKFIKDADKQSELQDDESLAGAGGSQERRIARAKEEYESNPTSPDAITYYAKLLKQMSTPDSIKEAFNVLVKGFKDTSQYRFRMEAADIKIAHDTENITQLQNKFAETGNEELKKNIETSKSELLAFKKQEFEERSVKYPTDRAIKFQLGLLAIEDNDVNLAMECFQKSKDEPKLRVRAGYELGKCFVTEGWYAEAIGEFKESIKTLAGSDNSTELSIRYDLMQALAKKAENDQNVELAREALEICSGIARKDISYRDIRDCRRNLDSLVKDLD